MRKTYFLINPESGKKQGSKLHKKIEGLWKEAGVNYEICVTSHPLDIATCVDKAFKGNATEIVIAGGDGTLMETVRALNGRAIPLGVIPCGTGNDFIRSHEISASINEALQTVLRAKNFKAVDVGVCNGSYFLNIASVGIDAAIVKRTSSLKKWLRGPLVYLAASIIEILKNPSQQVSITIDGVNFDRTVEMVVIANGRFYGGGMMIAPMADPTDGSYDVLVVKKMNRLRLFNLLPSLYTGKHIGEPEVEVFKGCTVRIHCDEQMIINRDGELSEGKILEVSEVTQRIQLITNI